MAFGSLTDLKLEFNLCASVRIKKLNKFQDKFVFVTCKENLDPAATQHFVITREGKTGRDNENPAILTSCQNDIFVRGEKVKVHQKRILLQGDIVEIKTKNKRFEFTDHRPRNDSRFSLAVRSRFYIGEKLGSGLNGAVLHAKDVRTLEDVAIKTLLKSPAKNEFLRKEIDLMRKLIHPHLVSMLEVIESPNRIYLIFEMMNAGNLLELCQDSDGLEELDAKFAILQVCQGLQFMHRNKIAHLDLKLENILVTRMQNEFIYKIGDFETSSNDEFPIVRVATELYQSPEIYLFELGKAKISGMKSDMWSLGVVIYCCVLGSYPFNNSPEYSLRNQIWKRAIIPSSKWFKVTKTKPVLNSNFKVQFFQVSMDFRRLVLALMDLDPDRRLTTENIFQQSWFDDKALKARMQHLKEIMLAETQGHDGPVKQRHSVRRSLKASNDFQRRFTIR